MKTRFIWTAFVLITLCAVVGGVNLLRPKLEQKLTANALAALQAENISVESVQANWRTLNVKIFGSNPGKVRKVYDSLMAVPGVREVSVETLPIRDPSLRLEWNGEEFRAEGLTSQSALVNELNGVKPTAPTNLKLANDVKEEPLESTVMRLVQTWKQEKGVEQVRLGLESGRIQILAKFSDADALIRTSQIIKAQRDGLIQSKLILVSDKPSEEVAQNERTPSSVAPSTSVGGGQPLPFIRFSFGQSEISDSSRSELQQLAEMLKANPKLKVKVTGYTDDRGDARYNIYLSKQRALHVANELRKSGVSPSSLLIEGKGPSGFIADNETLAGRQLNRRVEFSIVRQG